MCVPLSAQPSLPSLLPARGRHHRGSPSTSALNAIKLYTNPGSRGKICEWALAELNVPYEAVVVDMKAGEHKKPEFMAINPFAKVPAMEDGALKLFESGAILLHLAQRHGNLTPDQLSKCYQWSLFANSTMTTAFFSPNKSQMNVILGVLEDLLTKTPYLEGEEFTLGDVAVASYLLYLPLFFPDMFPAFCETYPSLWRYMTALAARPSCPDSYKQGLAGINPPAAPAQGNPFANIFGKK